MTQSRPSGSVAADMSPLHLFIQEARAGLRQLLRFKYLSCGIWFVFCLLAGLMGFASTAFAQPETFGGNPDSNAFIRIPSNTDDWTRHFRIGAIVGLNISADFKMSGTFNVSGNNPAQGIYDNGYVRTDNTGNAGGYTSYWGYDKNSQYDLANQTLTMNATTSFSAANVGKESGVFPGFDMAYGDNLWYWKHARVGWELGFDLLPISLTERFSTSSATINQSTYVFHTGWPAGDPIPTAPYQGLPDGGINEATISTNYQSSTATLQDQSVTGSQTLDVMLYALRLGPTFYWDLSEHISMSLAAGPTVGLVSGDYKYDENIADVAHNSGKISGTDFIYGGYVNATVLCHVTDNADIYAGVQYMPMSDATISGNGRSGRLNLGGQVYFSVGVNWPF